MKITDVEIENFVSIGEAKFKLDDLGLVHVAGVNNDETSADSNGSGKSSLADAISWALWGSTARGVTGDEVVNTASGKNCAARITLDDDGEIFRVERYRKYAKHKNGLLLFKHDPLTDEWNDLTKGTTSLTQKAIERLLGCSEEVFNAAVYSGQEMMPDIPRMTDRQLKILVEQAAGVDVLANAYDIARKRLTGDRAKGVQGASQIRADAQVAYDRATERHTDALASVARLTDQSQQWETNQVGKVASLKAQTTKAVQDFTKAKDDLDPNEEAQVAAGIKAAQDKIASVKSEVDRERVLANDLTQAQTALATINRQLAAQNASVDAADRSVAAAEAAVQRITNGVGEPCDECGRALEAEHLADATAAATLKLQAQQADRARVVVIRDASVGKIAAFERAVAAADQALTDHRASMTDVSAEGARLNNLQRELQIIRAAHNEVDRLKTHARNVGEQWKREAAAENPFKPMIDTGDKLVIQRAAEAAAAKGVVVEAMEEEAYAQAVVDVFAPDGVRAHRLDEATPYLNDRTSHYLGSLSDGAIDAFWTTLSEKKAGGLTEKFSVTVEKAGSAPSFNALSGGEKRKVRLACALALQDLVATRASKNIELWIGDEIDDALDSAGLERLMGVLEEKARDRGTVLVISHNDIAAYARKTIVVEKTGGRATVSVQ